MNITEIVQTSGWKNFMAKLYGIGASVVIIGALFKIMHWPYASVMLILGLSTEAVIFFFSAFEPLHEELDWTLVYPELAGMSDPEEISGYKDHHSVDPAKGISGGGSIGGGVSIAGISGLASLPEIKPETITALGTGLTKLSDSVSNLADISDASIATKDFFTNVKKASDGAKTLSETYMVSNDSLKESSAQLSNSYSNTAVLINKSGEEISITYQKLSTYIQTEHEAISKSTKVYEDQLEQLNKRLSALNSVFELQLQDTNTHLKESRELYSGFDQMNKNLKESVQETIRYKDELSKLSNNLSALNDIYGNMLSSVNMSISK